MKNSQLPDFTIIRCDDKAALVDPESKVCLIVSKRIADTLNLKETNDKIYPIWSKQAEFQRKIDAKREKINTLYLMVTRQCNMNCDFCAINANQNMKINKEFTLESVNERIIPFLSYISPHKVVITGGEPFVKKDIVDIVGNIRKKVKCPIILQSNGLAVDETKLEFLSSQINEINFSTKHISGKMLSRMNDNEITIFRRRNIGFIFQNYNLLPSLSVYENIVLPVELDGGEVDHIFLDEIIEMLQLKDKIDSMPNKLSGGQQQRVAIARALIAKPAIVLADEPTGNLDSKSSADVLGLLKRTGEKFNQTIVMITHNNEIAQLADRIIRIEDGRIVE